MNHPRNTQFERVRAPRTLSDAFGPYAHLTIERKSNAKQWVWAIGLGAFIGCCWYVGLGIWVGP